MRLMTRLSPPQSKKNKKREGKKKGVNRTCYWPSDVTPATPNLQRVLIPEFCRVFTERNPLNILDLFVFPGENEH